MYFEAIKWSLGIIEADASPVTDRDRAVVRH